MDAKELRNLQEAYLDVYQELDESNKENKQKKNDAVSKIIQKKLHPSVLPSLTYGRRELKKEEQVDLYDIILSHLLDEGYAETVESAQAIMVNMSEEWRDEIVEEMLDEANKAEKMLGLTPRQREQARNLHQYTGKPIFYGTNPNRRKKPDRSDPILNKSHKDMTAKRQASHKAGRHLRGDTGESGNVVRSRYQANKDHKDGYPSIKRVDT